MQTAGKHRIMGTSSIRNYFLIIVLFLNSLRADDNLKNAVCFKEYWRQSNQILVKYLIAHKACDNADNIHRKPPGHIDIEGERQKFKELSNETCSSLNACNVINTAHDFFHCHSNTAHTNINKFVLMHLAASSTFIELNDQYVEEEKELLRCFLAAKQSYLNGSINAYNQHLECLNNSKYLGKTIEVLFATIL